MGNSIKKIHANYPVASSKAAGFFIIIKIMSNDRIYEAVKRLVACGMTPEESSVSCRDFVDKFGYADLGAYARSVEVMSCGKNIIRIRQGGE